MNDHDLFIIVGVLLGLYALVVFAQGLYRIYQWLKHSKTSALVTVLEESEGGLIPRNYSRKMKAALEEVNALASTPSTIEQAESARYKFERLKAIRVTVARIMDQGFAAGMRDRDNAVFNEKANPYPRGSGAAQQWVRGYCMGQNVTDPKPYMEAA